MRYIRHYNKAPRTVKWKYADPSRQHRNTISWYRPLAFGILRLLMWYENK